MALRTIFYVILPLIFLIFPAWKVHAQEVHPFYMGARAAGMGGAQIAVVDDETAILANPAGLGKLRDYYGTILDPEFTFSQNLNGIYAGTAFSSPFDLKQVSASLNTSPNTNYYAKMQLLPSFVVRNFGIGFFYRQELSMLLNNAKTSTNTFYWQDIGLILSYNLRLFDGRIKIGVAGKVIDRVEVNNTALAFPGNYNLQNIASEGAGFDSDVGINLAGPWTWIPTISAVLRDMGGMNFTQGKNIQMSTTTTPTAQTPDADIAVAVFPILANRTRSSFTIEAQKIQAAGQSLDKIRYLHVGYELNYLDTVFLRAGLNGHSWTAGMEISNFNLQFQFATYGQDIGTGTAISEDRRYVVKFAFRF